MFCTPSWLLTTVFYGLHVYVDYIFCLRKSLTLCSLSRQAPSSLLEALEQHLASLEGKKVKDSTAASRYINPLIFSLDHSNYLNIYIRSVILTYLCCTASGVNLFPCRASTLSNAVSSLASTGMSFTKVDEREKQAALEEEQARLKALKVNAFLKRKMKHYFTWHALNLPSVGFFFFFFWLDFITHQEQRLKELSKRPSFATTDTSPISTTGGTISTAPAIDLFSTPSCSNGYCLDLYFVLEKKALQ